MQPDGVDSYVYLFVVSQRLNSSGDRVFVEMERTKNGKIVGISVGQEVENLTWQSSHPLTIILAMLYADIALSAIVFRLLTEIGQQLTATALLIVEDIVHHRLEPLLVFLFPVLIDMRRDDHFLNADAVLKIGDLRNMAVGDEVDDVLALNVFNTR